MSHQQIKCILVPKEMGKQRGEKNLRERDGERKTKEAKTTICLECSKRCIKLPKEGSKPDASRTTGCISETTNRLLSSLHFMLKWRFLFFLKANRALYINSLENSHQTVILLAETVARQKLPLCRLCRSQRLQCLTLRCLSYLLRRTTHTTCK